MSNPSDTLADTEAECSVLACCLLNTAARIRCVTELKHDDFTGAFRRSMFDAIGRLEQRNAPLNRVFVMNEMKAVEQWDPEFVQELGNLSFDSPVVADVDAWITLLLDISNRRTAAQRIKDLQLQMENPHWPWRERLSSLDRGLRTLDTDNTGVLRPIDAFQQYAEMRDRIDENPDSIPRWPWNKLQKAIEGLFPGDLWIVAGLPAHGKSTVMLQAALDWIRQHRVQIFSLEMEAGALMARAVRMQLGKDLKLAESREDPEVLNWLAEIDGQLFLNEKCADLNEICSRIRAAHACGECDIALVDHIGIVRTRERGDNRAHIVGVITGTLKQLARELGIPIVAGIQYNREGAKQGLTSPPKPWQSRDGGRPFEDADGWMTVWNPYLSGHVPEDRSPRVIGKWPIGDSAYMRPYEIEIQKCRDGRANASADLWWNELRVRVEDEG